MERVDLTIIGGGPVGLFAAYYARLRNVRVRVIESLAEVGGQVTALYPQKEILDVAGFPNVIGHQLVNDLDIQAKQLEPEIVTNTSVIDVIKLNDGFEVVTTTDKFESSAVIIATGRGNFSPRKLPFNNLPKQVEAHIHYFVGAGDQFIDRNVLIAGGGDSAVDAALQLEPLAKNVHLMHRRAQFRALEHSVSQLQASTVKLEVPFLMSDLTMQADGKLLVTMQEVMGDATKQVVVDDILVSYGFTSENATMASWNIKPDSNQTGITVDQTLQSSIPGIFAIGDAAVYPGKTELLSTGFGEAPLAVNAALRFINLESRGPIHSSSLKIANGHVIKD